MKRSSFHYWLFIFAILARLVLGEVAHAMPQPPEPTTQECANHTSADTHETSAPSDDDCCKSTQCECACIHATEFAGARIKAAFGPSDLPSLHLFLANPTSRLNELFRPPA